MMIATTLMRDVEDDLRALFMCNAMLRHGFEPFSVVHVPKYKTAHWHVFGKGPEEQIEAVDNEFDRLCAPLNQ